MKHKYLAWAIPMLFSAVPVHAQNWQENQKDVSGPSGSSSSAGQQVAQNAAAQNGAAANSGSADVGRITVEGRSPGAGFIQQEESPKARSSVTKEAIERINPSSNPYQAMNLMPGVSTYSQDATGLFGGSLRVRGFNSDQMGFTLDGVPVNDSGAFTVFPNEYIDIENLQEIFLTQGSSDNEAPHVGATGGNIGLNIVRPHDIAGANINQSIGDLHYTRTFARLDTGLIDDRYKAFISYSHSEAYKFRGQGEADRDHVDFNGVLKLAPQSSITAGFYFNHQLNNSFRPLNKLQAEQDYFQDYGSTPVHHVAAGTDVIPTNNFYGLELNPFVNYTATVKGNFQLSPNTRLDFEPYYWYGYGGAVFPTTLRESASGIVHGGVADINGNGNRTDTVEILRGSITETFRPGFTVKLTHQLDNHRLVGGFWLERARQVQTGPALRIDNNGKPASSIWFDNPSQFVLYNDGTPDQSRNTYTVTTGKSVFLQDTATFFNDKLTIQPGIKHIGAHRDFQNYANDTTGSGADYHLSQDYYKTVSSLGVKYQFTPQQSSFFNVGQNFKIPGNFSYGGLIKGTPVVVNGVATNVLGPPGVPETSINFDLGYRYAGERLTASATMFDVEFKNRLTKQFDVNTGFAIETNVGNAAQRGVELEAGYKLDRNWTLYGSASYTFTQMKDNLFDGFGGQFEPTAGKQLPDTPEWLAGFSAQYVSGNWGAGTSVKYTGRRYATLVNDESAGGYTLVDLNASYKLPGNRLYKSATLKFNMTNLFDARYLALNAGSGSLFTNRAQPVAGLSASPSAPQYFTGALRFSSVTFAMQF